ncbi:MAG: hypothetical protein K6T94_20340 [Paenibacillus sp.]|nr:hypothetical protein [Paenibacillus sp.]
MVTIYEGLPLPIYLIITLGVSTALSVYFLKNSHNYPKTFLFGIFLLLYASFSAGLVRISLAFGIVTSPTLEIVKVLPLPGLLGFPFICVGSYLKVKTNPLKKKVVVITSLSMLLMVLMVMLVVILKMLER